MSNLSTPHSFVNGNVTDATEMNENFDAVEAIVNGALDTGNLSASAGITAAQLATAVAEALGLTQGGTARRDYAEVLTEQTTVSTSLVDLATPGPAVTVSVPSSNGIVCFVAEAELKTSSGTAIVGLVESGVGTITGDIMNSTSAVYEKIRSAHDSAADVGEAGSVLFVPASAGIHTYRLQYSVGAGTGTFKNRKLWAWALGGFS